MALNDRPMAASRAHIDAIREQLDHPIVDADGHLLESVPMLFDTIERVAGAAPAVGLREVIPQLFTGPGSVAEGVPRGPWWPSTTDALYQATVMVPTLLAERLGEIGIDFMILYPSLGLALATIPEDEIRLAAIRGLNTMLSEICGGESRILTPAAVIPMHTPEEAIAELHFVRELGLKVAMIPPAVARPLAAYPDHFPRLAHSDRFGIDSIHDYDPVWHTFQQLGLAVTAHGAVGLRYLEGGRGSPTNYSFNHVLGHGYMQSELCRALVYGGVPMRFPDLPFAFLEGGAAWAVEMLGALEEHYEKRGPDGLHNYDPARLDAKALAELLARHGFPPEPPEMVGDTDRSPWARNEFEDSGIQSEADLARIFREQFYFGCESDDVTVHRALDGPGNPMGVSLSPIFSSDIGHWDVPQLDQPVPNSFRLVEQGRLSREGYRVFVFDAIVRLHTRLNPDFFAGTVVESALAQ
jgi:predicted TIM-barrel fold metal-dependent hydrolase